MKLKFNNYTFVHGGREHLASGIALWHVEQDVDEDDAVVDDVALSEIISPSGWVKESDFPFYKESVITSLNRNENFLRSLVQ